MRSVLEDFSKSSILKYFLTEGEKMLVVFTDLFSQEHVAEFSLVANLIGLVNRFLFS